ncbi:MAG TPA: hypothetical protein VMI75_01925 [Polyangiaceae bacterium]|nr:hypothetical protein [Polyangiaceae bacterium]
MRLVYALASTALLSVGCGLDFDRYEGGGDGSASSDATGSADALDAAQFDAPQDAGSGTDGPDATGPDGSDGSSTTGPDGAACGTGMATCGSTCVPSCASCDGGTDFVTCLVCADGGPPALVCAPANPSGFCLDGNYAHCRCQQDSDCPAANQRCTNNECTACGEPLFDQNHTRCNPTGNCCKTGANLGKCSC